MSQTTERIRSHPHVEALVLEHADVVRRLAMRMLRNPADADDATQETFLRAYRTVDGFRGDATVRRAVGSAPFSALPPFCGPQHRCRPSPRSDAVTLLAFIVDIGVLQTGLVFIVVVGLVGYVTFRTVQASRQGASPLAAAGRAFTEGAPPALLLVVATPLLIGAAALLAVLLLLAIGLLVVGVFVAAFGGSVSFGPLGQVAGLAVLLLAFAVLLLVLGGAWAAVAALQRIRRPRRDPRGERVW